MRLVYFLFFAIIITLNSCISPNQTYSKIPPGLWRGVLFLDGEVPIVTSKKEVIVGKQYVGELPFSFEVVYDENDNFSIVIINAKERIKVDGLKYGRDKSTAKDTLVIPFLEYDTYIKAIVEENIMEGYWHVNYKEDYKIKFKAIHGDGDRFKNTSPKPVADFNGKYEVKFSAGTEVEYPAVGVFNQNGLKLTGTFHTETGDYRYLDGKVFGDKALLSCFDGAHAFLIEMKKIDDKIIGEFRSGTHHREPFEGSLNQNAILKSGFDLVGINSSKPFYVKFPNTKGQIISTESEEYKNKVKIYDIMGTWCPNCKDAAEYLRELSTKHSDIKITSLAFERYRDSLVALEKIKNYEAKMKLPFETLLAGYYNKKEASLVLPQIDTIKAYPTLMIVDKKDRIRKVYTGFYGPATTEYENFKTEFEKIITELKNE
jgi:thiol-disulfide isomerase/thioredoxin